MSTMMSMPQLPDSLSEESGANDVVSAATPAGEKATEFSTPQKPSAGTHRRPPKSGSKRTPKSTAQRDRDARLPSARSGSVFDRLYKTQTAASKAWTPARQKVRQIRTPNSKSKSVDDELKVFTRLHITGTISNTSKRLTHRHNIRITPERKKLSPAKTDQYQSPFVTKKTTSYVYSPRMKPLTKLYFDSKYHPGLGVESVDPIKLGYSFFQSFCEYENGGLDAKQIAREIIVAFFKKDFPAGR